MKKLEPNANWFLGSLSEYSLKKERLKSPFVHYIINSLNRDWAKFAHTVHFEIYKNYDQLTQYFEDNVHIARNELIMCDYWEYILSQMGKEIKHLPEELQHLIIFHLG